MWSNLSYTTPFSYFFSSIINIIAHLLPIHWRFHPYPRQSILIRFESLTAGDLLVARNTHAAYRLEHFIIGIIFRFFFNPEVHSFNAQTSPAAIKGLRFCVVLYHKSLSSPIFVKMSLMSDIKYCMRNRGINCSFKISVPLPDAWVPSIAAVHSLWYTTW